MNLRLLSLLVLASAMPMNVSAGSSRVSLNEGDFLSAQRSTRHGGAVVKVRLSKSGKAKLRKLRGQ